MENPFKILPILLLLALPVKAQTNQPVATTNAPTVSGALSDLFTAVKDNTNLIWETHAIYAPGLSQRWGGGAGVAYQVSQYVFASTRLELIDHSLVMPVGNVGLQLPISLGSWFHATPFAYAGIGFPLSGMVIGGVTVPGQARSLDPIAIVGAGAAVRVYTGSKVYVDLVVDIEKWGTIPQNEYRAGVAVHF